MLHKPSIIRRVTVHFTTGCPRLLGWAGAAGLQYDHYFSYKMLQKTLSGGRSPGRWQRFARHRDSVC